MIDFRTLNLSLPALRVLDRLGLYRRSLREDRWRGQCPYHQSSSRRPRSLKVSLTLRKWHCKRCGAHGDLIDLWAHMRCVSLPTAAAELAEEFGNP